MDKLLSPLKMEEQSTLNFRRTLFTLEAIRSRTFHGYTDGQTWNGWARPYFTYEVGLQIVDAMKLYRGAAYDAGEEEVFSAINAARSRKVYPIGSSSWTWEEGQLEPQVT
ncbi:hypothetical protein IAD21_00553 [Abditibacteriota bacterium]|nr:hypothetical protein IAD21_00553 [Abditibacteriota bacterium]